MENSIIEQADPEIARIIAAEEIRQKDNIELIASENIASRAVMAVQGSVLTNKYAEGYPNKRYYGGCENVDLAEQLAIDRAKELFDATYANVQPHSGSQANMAAYFALLKPGDKILGMNLAHGGHLTHGSPVSFSGQIYNFIHYGVKKESGRIDYEQLADLAQQYRPKMIVAGASAYPRILNFAKFAEIAQSIGAFLMVDMAHIAGLVAAGLHPSPIPFADVVTSTTHKTLRGPRGGLILSKNNYQKKLNSEVFPGIQGGPLMHVIAAKALAFKEALNDNFKIYQTQIIKNAKALAARLLDHKLELVSGGTDNHLLLVDLRNMGITGKDAETVLGKAGITVNKNFIPFEEQSPFITSGIRLGTPYITSRGMQEAEMEKIADMLVDVLKNPAKGQVIDNTIRKVKALCDLFPPYPK